MKILGYTYQLYIDGDSDHIGAAGRMHSDLQKIQVASNLSQQQRESTVLHEVLEAINYHLMIGLGEREIMNLEAALYQFFNDNGISLASLTRELEGDDVRLGPEGFEGVGSKRRK